MAAARMHGGAAFYLFSLLHAAILIASVLVQSYLLGSIGKLYPTDVATHTSLKRLQWPSQ